MTRAVIAAVAGAPLEVREVDPGPLGPNDVRVRLVAAGVCHSDLSITNGTIPCEFPVVLGHEAAGVVAEVGSAVSAVAPGAHVVLNWAPPCRACFFCTHGEPWLCVKNAGVSNLDRGVRLEGSTVYSTLGLGAFSEEVVLPEGSVVVVPDELPLEVAALLGCAVLTGLGAVVHPGHVHPGDSVAVVGLGGVGLSALAGARLAGAGTIVAIDRAPDKEALARAEGASEFVLADEELARRVRGLTEGRGADHVFDCVGSAATIRASWNSARRGGRVTVVGVGRRSESVEFNPLELFHQARTLTSSIYGSSDPEHDLPALVAHVLAGEVDVERLVTHRCGLEGVGEAFSRMEQGVGGRTVIELGVERG
jgi:S-(hydroxymethyl)glutathione dehydrogenase/alcohol dehydrogenase